MQDRAEYRMGKLGKLVLVVAQGTALRAKIARLLQPSGYAVELAANQRRALDLAVHVGIDAAILVIGSGLADLAFARRLSDRIPRLIVLAKRSPDMARLDRSLPSAEVHLSQPLDEQKLLGHLAELIAAPGKTPRPWRRRLCGSWAAGSTCPVGPSCMRTDARWR